MNPAIKVVMFSAMSEPELINTLIAAGAAAFVSKLAGGDLLETIRRLCATGF
jgi:DNA-binding NarL/FixJ family response regulator